MERLKNLNSFIDSSLSLSVISNVVRNPHKHILDFSSFHSSKWHIPSSFLPRRIVGEKSTLSSFWRSRTTEESKFTFIDFSLLKPNTALCSEWHIFSFNSFLYSILFYIILTLILWFGHEWLLRLQISTPW